MTLRGEGGGSKLAVGQRIQARIHEDAKTWAEWLPPFFERNLFLIVCECAVFPKYFNLVYERYRQTVFVGVELTFPTVRHNMCAGVRGSGSSSWQVARCQFAFRRGGECVHSFSGIMPNNCRRSHGWNYFLYGLYGVRMAPYISQFCRLQIKLMLILGFNHSCCIFLFVFVWMI